MNPLMTTNYYLHTPQQFTRLYGRELVRQHWLLFILFPGIFLIHIINTFRIGYFYQGFLSLAIALGLFLLARYRFVSGIKKNRAFHSPRRLSVYSDKLVIAEENGSQQVISFEQIEQTTSGSADYCLKLTTGNLFWIPKNAFGSEADRNQFEQLLDVK